MLPFTSLSPPAMTASAAVQCYTGRTPKQLGLSQVCSSPRTADQLRCMRITDVQARRTIRSCYFFTYEALYPSCVWTWASQSEDWDAVLACMDRRVPYWPDCQDAHCWNPNVAAAFCQTCGADNDERRLVIRFSLANQAGSSSQFIFTCLPKEWAQTVAHCRSHGAISAACYAVDAVYPHLRFPQEGFHVERVADLQVLDTQAECEEAISTASLPRVTPSFIKRFVASPCELGEHGRCFCPVPELGGSGEPQNSSYSTLMAPVYSSDTASFHRCCVCYLSGLQMADTWH
jgi:hypothetical protein